MAQSFEHGHACVIGVGADLPNTVNDAKGLAKVLKDPERCAYLEEQVYLLTGEAATRSNIIQTLDSLANSTTGDSTVLIYFSGHGYQLHKPFKSYYLIPYGYERGELSDTAISGGEFVDLLREIPARQLLVILDCCHAGGVVDLSEFEMTKSSLPPEAVRMFSRGGGRIIIGSSMPDEVSLTGNPYSAFTHALLQGLCGKGAVKQDGYVRATDLAMYASQVVPTFTSNKQHPMLDIERADNFILAYYAGGETKPKGLPKELIDDPNIESESEESIQSAQNTYVEVSGDGAIGIGDSADGATIVGGQGNVIGNNNFIKTVNQRQR
ncbi:MAG: caspase family protein [Cyanothece sp. SIO1E1]|nr:caspase family protein [Cyanothece sp. SIO1E1]